VLILDTDHLAEYQKGATVEAVALKRKLNETGKPYGTTIITVEEMMRGWLAAVRRTTDPMRQVSVYAKLRQLFRFFATWDVLDWSPAAAAQFVELRAAKVRAGTMDLRIASIALAANATLLTRNLQDFEIVPGLRTDDWLS
jgi:tRNA(fMet)-specific endonuclease VapC